MENWLEQGLANVVDVDFQEVWQHLQALLIESLIEELLGCLQHHQKDSLRVRRRNLLLYEKTEFLNSFFGVFLHEIFHIEGQDRIL